MKSIYSKKERFFKIKEHVGGYTVQLNIAFPYGLTEFILFIENRDQKIKTGGPFTLLLKKLDLKADKSVLIPFSSLDELRQVLEKGIGIFVDIKNEIEKQETT